MFSRFLKKRKKHPKQLFKFLSCRTTLQLRRFRNFLVEASGRFKYQSVVAGLLPADIILASPRTLRLSPVALLYRIFLGSKYVHSMLYIGRGKVIHTTTEKGVCVASLPGKIHRKNHYTILRVPYLQKEQRKNIVNNALKFRYKGLDFAGLVTNIPARLIGLRKPLIRMEKNRVWCSKLIYHAFAAQGIKLVPAERAQRITSEDLSCSPHLQRILDL